MFSPYVHSQQEKQGAKQNAAMRRTPRDDDTAGKELVGQLRRCISKSAATKPLQPLPERLQWQEWKNPFKVNEMVVSLVCLEQ